MQQQYQTNTGIVIDYLAAVGRGKDTLRAYTSCYNSLGDALNREGVSFSSKFAFAWLDQQSDRLGNTTFALYRAALRKLDEVYQTGEVQHDNLNPEKTRFHSLQECFKQLIDDFITTNSTLSPTTLKDYRYQLCDILFYFQKSGCLEISDISYDVLFRYCDILENRTYHVKSLMHSRLNSLLCFLYERGQATYGYTLFVTGIAMRKIRFWDSVSPDIIRRWRAEQDNADNVFSLGAYLAAGDTVFELHRKNGYGNGCLTSIRQAVNLFYLFMDVNSLKYMPQHGILWAESLKPQISATESSGIRRILIMVGHAAMGIPIDLKAVFSTRTTALQKLPGWCSGYVTEFLNEKKAENMARNTISMMCSSCCRFCFFLDRVGINSFSQVTSLHIKQFNLTDKHKTPAGKNAYNSRIRRFLLFLADRNALSNPFLFLALPRVNAPRETLVIVLSGQEQDHLRSLFESDNDDISLRHKAILQLGLYMGLRGIDIINLVIGDINWEDVSIRFVQEKTGYELYLPMPSDVANALYRYIVRERPVSSNPRVFLRSRAPYCELETTFACTAALEKALPERSVEGSGFHVTRKTFATNKLQGGAAPDEVREMLGHRDRANVHKYLSLDESRMKLCCMDLGERSIRMEGRFGR